MAARSKRAGVRVSRGERLRTWLVVLSITCIPVLGTLLAVVATTEPDLGDLRPISQEAGQPPLINWPELERGQVPPEMPVRALGYMLESDSSTRTGDWVQEFALVPEAGNLLHPAHRFASQLIAVHLREGDRIRFSPRGLTWAWGRFRATPDGPGGAAPSYNLEEASAQHAEQSEIPKYFK